MIKQSVREWMSTKVITARPRTTIPEAHQMMKEHRIRRLPVMENDKLVGIVTLGDVREAGPSDATSLSIYELNYLLTKLTIGEIMTPDPFILSPETSLQDAAKLMLEKKIGGLPVMEDGKLVGIITESDIFRAVMANFEEG